MKLYGKSDENFGDMGDFTGDVLIPLDFNTVSPLLQRKPVKCFSVCEDSYKKLFELFKKQLTKEDVDNDLLILMRVKGKNSKSAYRMGCKISWLLGKDSLVCWVAQNYKTYRFDFYFYEKQNITEKRLDLFYTGLELEKTKKYKESNKYYHKFLRFNPKHKAALHNIAINLYALKQYKKSLGVIDKALKIDHNDIGLLWRKSYLLLISKDYKKSLEFIRKVLEIEPTHDIALYYRGVVLEKLRRYKEALKSYDDCLKIYPKDKEALANKKAISKLLGDKNEK